MPKFRQGSNVFNERKQKRPCSRMGQDADSHGTIAGAREHTGHSLQVTNWCVYEFAGNSQSITCPVRSLASPGSRKNRDAASREGALPHPGAGRSLNEWSRLRISCEHSQN